MDILICNDDGILSEGLLSLAKLLKLNNNVTIIAPEKNCSGFSHAMTFHSDITINKIDDICGISAYTISGTPADCVRVGVEFLNNIDLVISGINFGSNLGTDIYYSGTVNACIEANIHNIPAIAFSKITRNNLNFENCIEIIDKYFNNFLEMTSSEYTLNINMPDLNLNDIKGFVVCDAGENKYDDRYVKVENKENTYQLVGETDLSKIQKDTDVYYGLNGYITITPIKHSITQKDIIERLKGVKF